MGETLHVVFGMSAADSVRKALQQLGCEDRVVGFIDDLSCGPIDRATARSRKTWIAEHIGYEYGEVYGDVDRFWAEVTAPDASPVAWVCRNHALEYAAYLEFVWRMGETPFRVVDATDTKVPEGHTRIWSLGVLTPPQLIEAGLFESQRSVSAEERARHRELWRRLRVENAPFRVVDATGLVSAPITHFDEAILSCVTPAWQKGARVVGEAMCALIEKPFPQCLGDMVIWGRIRALAEMGRIEIDGPGPSMREHRLRLAPAGPVKSPSDGQ